MLRRAPRFCLYAIALAVTPALYAAPREVSFPEGAESVDAYDFVEVTAQIAGPDERLMGLSSTASERTARLFSVLGKVGAKAVCTCEQRDFGVGRGL